MKFIVELSHPKHFYQFRPLVTKLETDNNKIIYLARNKDVLINLLEENNIDFEIYGPYSKSFIGKWFITINILFKYILVILRHRPDYIISKASPYAAVLSKLFNVKTIVFPDSEIVTLTNNLVAPLSSLIITPRNFSIDFGKKHHRINGLFENCYLDPNYFTPNKQKAENLMNINSERLIILRFISWNANHDLNASGFNEVQKIELVNFLSKYGKVYITAEGKLPKQLDEMRIKIQVSDIHDALSIASLYIGDSQTMATEAALLGTPSIRYNSFVGDQDMSNFILLENKYSLIYNFSDFQKVKDCAEKILINIKSKSDWHTKKSRYFEDSGDVNQEIFNLIKEFFF